MKINIPFKFCFLLVFFIFSNNIFAENYRLILKDKGKEIFSPSSKKYRDAINSLSSRSIERRLNFFSTTDTSKVIFESDVPVNPIYIDSLKKIGLEIKMQLKWNNYLIVSTDDSLLMEKAKLISFVDTITPAYSKLVPMSKLENNQSTIKKSHYNDFGKFIYNCGVNSYGQSFDQLQRLNVISLHEMGINGEDVLLGISDTGFRLSSNSAFANINVFAEHDFVFNDDFTFNESNDRGDQDNHGTGSLSAIAGDRPDSLVGIARRANFILCKTENLNGESHLEEDNYAAAMEWIESLGGDIATSSLGYLGVDSVSQSYGFSDLDGSRSIVSRAVNQAAKLGVICLTSAGNAGPNPSTIISPADADSVVAIGGLRTAVDSVVNFSSRGPAYPDKIKPDLCAKAENVLLANVNADGFNFAGGTSFSCPLVAGSFALVKSLFPHKKSYEIKDAMFRSASNYPNKNNDIGYGQPDVMKAAMSLGDIVAPYNTYVVSQFQRIACFIKSNTKVEKIDLFVDLGDGAFSKYIFYATTTENLFVADIPLKDFVKDTVRFYYQLSTLSGTNRYPYFENKYYSLVKEDLIVRCGVNPDLLPKAVDSSVESFVFDGKVTFNPKNFEMNIPLMKAGKIEIGIYDILGNLVIYKDLGFREEGVQNIAIDMQAFAQGAYLCRVNAGEFVSNLKINLR